MQAYLKKAHRGRKGIKRRPAQVKKKEKRAPVSGQTPVLMWNQAPSIARGGKRTIKLKGERGNRIDFRHKASFKKSSNCDLNPTRLPRAQNQLQEKPGARWTTGQSPVLDSQISCQLARGRNFMSGKEEEKASREKKRVGAESGGASSTAVVRDDPKREIAQNFNSGIKGGREIWGKGPSCRYCGKRLSCMPLRRPGERGQGTAWRRPIRWPF